MNLPKLIEMANQIGRYHAALPDRAEALTGTAMHIRRFWEPRMRRELLAHIDATGGTGLEPIVIEAIGANRAELQPAEAAGQ